MSNGTEQRKLAAIMFTDMVGYSALAQRNEALALELLEEHRGLLRSLFPRFNGREVKTIGDAFLVEFHSALEAAQCAIEIQRTLAKRNHDVPAAKRIEVRIGIHIGDVVQRADGDVLGDGVNIASRIEPLAGAGGICISVDVERQIRNTIEASLIKLGATELKNIQVPMEIYRVVLPWQKATLTPAKVWSGTARPNGAPSIALAALAAFLVAGGIWFVTRKSGPSGVQDLSAKVSGRISAATPARIESVAVLPLDNFSGDTNKNYFADGMTDDLIAKLAQISALKKVISRTTMMNYRGAKRSIPDIARELNVDAVVEGSVVLSGNRVTIKVQLIEAARERHLWNKTYEREITDILQLQNEVAVAIAQAIQVALTPGDQARFASARPVNAEAYKDFQLGRFYYNNFNGVDNLKAIELLDHAIVLDQEFAAAHALLALACIEQYYAYAPQEYDRWEAKAALAARRALEIDPNLAEAYIARGRLLWTPVRNFRHEDAVTAFYKALALNPNSSDAHYFLVLIYGHTGLLDEALTSMKRSLELDPLATGPLLDGASVHLWRGDYDQALFLWSKVPRGSYPFFAGSHAAWTLFALQRANDALDKVTGSLKDYPKDETGELAGMKAVLLAARGDMAGAEGQIENAKKKKTGYGEFHHTAYFLAAAYAHLNRPTEAMHWLNDAATTGFPCYLLFRDDANLNNLRKTSQFIEFLHEQEKAWRKRKETWFKADPASGETTPK